MPRYRVAPHAYVDLGEWANGETDRRDLTVTQSDPIITGLVDKEGRCIVRMPEPIGFVTD